MNGPSNKFAVLIALIVTCTLFAGWARAAAPPNLTCTTSKTITHLADGRLAISTHSRCEYRGISADQKPSKQPARKSVRGAR